MSKTEYFITYPDSGKSPQIITEEIKSNLYSGYNEVKVLDDQTIAKDVIYAKQRRVFDSQCGIVV